MIRPGQNPSLSLCLCPALRATYIALLGLSSLFLENLFREVLRVLRLNWALVILYVEPIVQCAIILFHRDVVEVAWYSAVAWTHLFILHDFVLRTWHTVNVIPIDIVILRILLSLIIDIHSFAVLEVVVGLIDLLRGFEYLVRSDLLQTNQVLVL